MYIKFIWVSLITLVVIQDASGKRSKKKRISPDTAESTPQPNVLTYSTFGFNDVGSYDGFVPSSPDFANYLTKSQESSTRLYAPAFPSAPEHTGLGSYYDPQPDPGPFSVSSDMNESGKPDEQVSINFFTSPNRDINTYQGNVETKNEAYNFNSEAYNLNINSPIYGAKIGSKTRNKIFNNFNNNTDLNIFDSVSSVINRDASLSKNTNENYPSLPSAPSHTENGNVVMSSHLSSPLKFQKFVDFTSVKNYYPSSFENKYQESLQKPIVLDAFQNNVRDSNLNSFQNNVKDQKEEQSYKNKVNYVDEHTKRDKKVAESSPLSSDDLSNNYNKFKNNIKINRFKNDHKDKTKTKPWHIINNNNNKEGNKAERNPTNGYEYSTNYSSTSFQFDTPKKPFNSSIDEIAPASSNLNFVDYELPEKSFISFKNEENIKSSQDIDSQNLFLNGNRDKFKPAEEYLNSFKKLYSNVPSTTSHWGNIFKNSEFSSYKNHPRKPFFDDETTDEIVHIPKRQQNYKYGKYFDTKVNDLSFANTYKPFKISDNKPDFDWPKDFFNTGFKSEEDLLGLRNHDTARPYFKPHYSDLAEEYDYKKLEQKWKQNYLRAKLRDANREYETYASETKPIHVPLPKPYPIEVPHPVIVPVPQPYPVKVPIPKPVAVPVIRELTVSIEKPVPYPVIKKVPYPVEKPVPVPVEKQVKVPVIKPYPVHIPQIRPVFHHIKPHDDRESDDDEDEYVPRPDTKRPVYKRPKTSHNRPRPSRRPSRMTYQDRNRKRIPNKRPSYHDQRPRRPFYSENRPHRYRDDEEDDSESSEFEMYCKRTGRC